MEVLSLDTISSLSAFGSHYRNMSSCKWCNLQNQVRSGELIELSSHVVAADTLPMMSTFQPYQPTLVGNLNNERINSGITKFGTKESCLTHLLLLGESAFQK